MRKFAWILALAMLIAIPTVALASTNPKEVWVTNCYDSQYKPKLIIISCGDASNFVQQLSWSSWSRTTAVASGVDKFNNCEPNCASGHYARVRATVTLTDPIHCKGRLHEDFNRMRLRFRNQTGPHSTQNVILGCPLKR
jgi:hypothetical protein